MMKSISYGEFLINIGIQSLFMIPSFHFQSPELVNIIKKSKYKRFQEILENIVCQKKRNKTTIKFLNNILKQIGLKATEKNKNIRVNGKQTNFYQIEGDNFEEIKELVILGDNLRLVELFNEMYKKHGRAVVYKIIHKPTKQFYIGCTKNINTRIKSHIYNLNDDNNNKRSNLYLKKLWEDSLDKDNDFEFIILEVTTNYKEREKELICIAEKETPHILINKMKIQKSIKVSPNIKEKLEYLSTTLGEDIQSLADKILEKGIQEIEQRP